MTEIENYLIVDRLFYVKAHSMDADEYGSYVTVTFYDTSKEDEDVDVNQVLFDKILEDINSASKIRVIVIQFVIMIFCLLRFFFLFLCTLAVHCRRDN